MPQMSPKATISTLLLAFCISLRPNTENPGSKHHSCFFHVHFSELTNVAHKNCTELPCSPQNSFASWVWTAGRRFQNPLETHCWIPPGNLHCWIPSGNLHCWIPPGNTHCWIPPKRICVRHAGTVLPVMCLTSLSLAGVSLPSCLSCWSGEQPVLGREGRAKGARPRGRHKHRNFLT